MKNRSYHQNLLIFSASLLFAVQINSGSCDSLTAQECIVPSNEVCLCQAVCQANDALNNFTIANSILDNISILNSSILSALINADQTTLATVSIAEQLFITQSLIEQSITNLINSTSDNIDSSITLNSAIDVAQQFQSNTLIPAVFATQTRIEQLYDDVESD